MIRAGLILPLRGMWRGGVNYYHNLLACYQQYPDPGVRLEIVTDSPGEVAPYRSDSIAIHHCQDVRNFSRRRLGDWPRILLNQALGYDPAVLRFVKGCKIDLLTHNTVGHQRDIKTLFWLPDFQHNVFPEHFSGREHRKREKELGDTALWGHLLLSSETAVGHFRRYYPALSAVKPHVLRFPNITAITIEPMSREELNARFPTRQPYFHLPNQFWMHKNHTVVVEALRVAPPQTIVICTGPMEDPRNRSYVPDLLASVRDAGLQQRFVCLGTVPYGAMVSLMHHSVAVLQPSLFEGWSTSVEEAKAMCKRILLSDIEVHREQAPPRATFFSRNSPQQLAAAMAAVLAEHDPEVEAGFAAQRTAGKADLEREWMRQFGSVIRAAARP
jgi:glycosyltransferase involved in cell wall biosynthesis